MDTTSYRPQGPLVRPGRKSRSKAGATAAAAIGRHLALLVFCCTVAVAAWPPARAYSCSAGGERLTVWINGCFIVAEAEAGTAPARPISHPLRPQAPATFLPAGVVIEHPMGRAAAVRLTVPMALAVAATGLPWLAVLLIRGGGLAAGCPAGESAAVTGGALWDALAGTLPVQARQGRPSQRGRLWTLRFALGAAALAAAWWCVYAMPRDSAGAAFSEAQALHVAAASWGVALATMLIAFD